MPLGGLHVSFGQSRSHPEEAAEHGAEGEARSREHHTDVCQLFSQGEALLQHLVHFWLSYMGVYLSLLWFGKLV